ncbi:restless-like transposase [Hirsutella rhossiliensis]|uniref:Restless-like transposase n=1 Tax=Hirsutella rhossiliensis TaxID=111463 RepID=A0A9P8N2H0_9HYPO|nr:restless-like transposase [Hirsutella rhossiliensis]KAH0966448.1 restless-like transposase [Hirsutella rhossiliensis]
MDAFLSKKQQLKEDLQRSRSRISISFDLWTSPNPYAILGVVAMWIDATGKRRSTVLGMRRVHGEHSGENLGSTVLELLTEYDIGGDQIGYFMLDNASSNDTAVEFILKELCPWMKPQQRRHRRLRCLGHIVNLCCQAFLMGRNCISKVVQMLRGQSARTYYAAQVLNPYRKWAWFRQEWVLQGDEGRQKWYESAQLAVKQLWETEYKEKEHKRIRIDGPAAATDLYEQYISTDRLHDEEAGCDEAIAYWLSVMTRKETSPASLWIYLRFPQCQMREDVYSTSQNNATPASQFMIEERYSRLRFQGIIIDTGAAKVSTAGYDQCIALQRADPAITLDKTTAGQASIKFGNGEAILSLGSIALKTPLGRITFHILKTPTPFLLSLADMDRLGIYFNNLTDTIVGRTTLGYPQMGTSLRSQDFTTSYGKLATTISKTLQIHLKDDQEFNYEIVADVLYLGTPQRPVLHVDTWEALRALWIDTYLGPPDTIKHDAGTNFASLEFRNEVERYHAPLRPINDTAGPNGIVPTLLVFGAYPRMALDSPPSATTLKRAAAAQKAMKMLRQLSAERETFRSTLVQPYFRDETTIPAPLLLLRMILTFLFLILRAILFLFLPLPLPLFLLLIPGAAQARRPWFEE